MIVVTERIVETGRQGRCYRAASRPRLEGSVALIIHGHLVARAVVIVPSNTLTSLLGCSSRTLAHSVLTVGVPKTLLGIGTAVRAEWDCLVALVVDQYLKKYLSLCLSLSHLIVITVSIVTINALISLLSGTGWTQTLSV